MNNTEKKTFMMSEEAQILKANTTTPGDLPDWITNEQKDQFNSLTNEEKSLIGSNTDIRHHFLVINKQITYPRLIQNYKERVQHASVQIAQKRGKDWMWWRDLYQEIVILLEEDSLESGYIRIIAKVDLKMQYFKKNEFYSRSNQIGLTAYTNLKDNLDFIRNFPERYMTQICPVCGSNNLNFNPTQMACNTCEFVGLL